MQMSAIFSGCASEQTDRSSQMNCNADCGMAIACSPERTVKNASAQSQSKHGNPKTAGDNRPRYLRRCHTEISDHLKLQGPLDQGELPMPQMRINGVQQRALEQSHDQARTDRAQQFRRLPGRADGYHPGHSGPYRRKQCTPGRRRRTGCATDCAGDLQRHLCRNRKAHPRVGRSILVN